MLGQWRRDDARADGIDASAAFSPSNAFCLNTNMVGLLGDDIRDHVVWHGLRTEEGERQQLIGRRKRQRMIVFLGFEGLGAGPVRYRRSLACVQ